VRECVVEVALHAFGGGGCVWEVGLSLQGTSKARQRASPRVEAGTKKRDRGTTRALCYCRGSIPRQVRVAIAVPAGRWRWECRAVVRYVTVCVRDPELTDLTDVQRG